MNAGVVVISTEVTPLDRYCNELTNETIGKAVPKIPRMAPFSHSLLPRGHSLLVWGSKYSKGSFYEPATWQGRAKKLMSKNGNKLIRVATGINANDFTANLRSIRKDVWKQIDTQEMTNTFLMEMILKCKYGGFRVTEMPVTFNARIHGESKMNLAVEAPKFIIKMVKYVLMYRFTGYKLNNKEV